MNTIRRDAPNVGILAAAAVLTVILLSIVALGFDRVGTGSSGIAGLFAPLRSYLFRNSLRNTMVVLAVALPLACLFGLAAKALIVHNERSRGVVTWLLLLPLAMPVALATPAWREILAASPALADGVWPALIAVGVIQAWRILPFATLFLLLARPVRRQRIAIALTLCFGAYVVVADTGVVLLLTGGAPFNATHLLTSWVYQTGAAGAMPGQAAVMATVLVLALAGLSWGVIRFAETLIVTIQDRSTRPKPSMENPDFVTSTEGSRHSVGILLLVSPVTIVLLLPLAMPLVLAGDPVRWPAALGELFGRRDYGFWLANTILLAGITAFVTLVIAPPGGRGLAARPSNWSRRSAAVLGVLGMTALPVAFVPLTWLQGRQPVSDGRLLLATIYGSAAICIGTWLVASVSRAELRVPSPTLARWLTLICCLLMTNEMASALALSNGMSRVQMLDSGMVTRLIFDASLAQPVVGLATLLPMLSLTIFYWWLVRSSIAPLLDLP